MKLGRLIEILSNADQDKKIEKGIGNPHSWRGSYDELAFEITDNTTVQDMLDAAVSSVGATFLGWKGGEYTMDLDTEIHIELGEGEYSDNETALSLLFQLMLT